MAEKNRGPILGYVGGIPVVNTAYSGNLKEMTVQQLEDKLWRLNNTPEPDSDEGFEAKMQELDAICDELKKKGLSEQVIADIRYPDRPKPEEKITWRQRIVRMVRGY
ncbi:MAG: hypothetical protein AAB451_03190 [Patescibacteria group bacterium]